MFTGITSKIVTLKSTPVLGPCSAIVAAVTQFRKWSTLPLNDGCKTLCTLHRILNSISLHKQDCYACIMTSKTKTISLLNASNSASEVLGCYGQQV